jgi:serine/threonine protein kinase
MSLAAGQKLGRYEILSPLGAGGMGEVYRARDTKLNREVALKVLPEVFARDAERMARFTRGAQVLASLNHPNIATIHGLEESQRDLRAGDGAGRGIDARGAHRRGTTPHPTRLWRATLSPGAEFEVLVSPWLPGLRIRARLQSCPDTNHDFFTPSWEEG